ncbi:MAG: hypothetical protein QME79_07690 [Bacillota bacterium]|nr:hypothetical protein [Bacillota bacterium]
MPFRDPEKRREYHREYSRLRRVCQTPGQTPLPSEFRLQTARDVITLLAEQVEAVRRDTEAGTLEKARCIGYLAAVALKAVEAANLEARIEALERAIQEKGSVARWA